MWIFLGIFRQHLQNSQINESREILIFCGVPRLTGLDKLKFRNLIQTLNT
jgi:hypothetical protein